LTAVQTAAPRARRGLSLRWRLAIAFGGIAVVSALVIGLVLVPILASHYATAERTYLEAAAERAVRDLSTLTWRDRATVEAATAELAAVSRARVTVVDDKGRVVADVLAPLGAASPDGAQPLPAPLGAGLFGDVVDDPKLPRSDQSVMRPVNRSDKAGGRLLGTVTISNAPAYGQIALRNVVQAWALASLLGIAVAALLGLLVSAWLLRPLRELTDASDRMAHGDLGVRADVDRADEVGRLAVSFNAMAERVEETVTSLRRFAADAAHGLGTPLTALQADLELAEGHAQSDDERRLLERATAQAERLGDISTGLLRLSRLETGDVATAPERLDLTALARHVADAVASRADQAEIELRLDLPDSEVQVVGHPDGLRVAIGDLVDNALKFTPAAGTVTLALRADGRLARLRVSDTGIGIPAADLPALFERFHRGANASAYPGSGLGLAIVRATIELDGGTVRAESDGAGSAFEVTLPLV
jgi:two-component system, OmpR family, sensor histidine kinase BaeS